MKIAIIGTGYVGLPSGVGFAEQGNQVICIDNNAEKINMLKNGQLTLFEDGLEALYKSNTEICNILKLLPKKWRFICKDIQ